MKDKMHHRGKTNEDRRGEKLWGFILTLNECSKFKMHFGHNDSNVMLIIIITIPTRQQSGLVVSTVPS